MKHYAKKIWIECRECKKDDPCMMYIPKNTRDIIPKHYCFMQAKENDEYNTGGKWKKPKWAETELTV